MRVVRERNPDVWDAFVAQQEHAGFQHLFGWSWVIGDVMKHEPVMLAAQGDDGATRAVLPLVHMRTPLFGSRLVSMPYLNYGGAIGDDEGIAAVEHAATEEAKKRGVRVLELRDRTPRDDAAQGSRRKITVLLDLPTDSSVLWDSLKSKLRSQVRRPIKEGMEVRFGASEVDNFHHVFKRNMRDLGTPPLPRAFFDHIASTFDGSVFGTVYHQGHAVASGAGFLFRDEFEMTWASSLREYNAVAPNMLLYWSFMEEMIRRGARTFNFGRCTPESGTHRFKLQWGGRDAPLGWRTWPGQEDDGGPGRLSELASRVWQRLPEPISSALGPSVARQLPWW